MESLAQTYNRNLFQYALGQSEKKLAIIVDEKSYTDNLPQGKYTVEHTGIVLRRFKIRILSEQDEGTPVENLPWAYGQSPNSGLRGESIGVPIYPPNTYVDVVSDPDTGIYYILGAHCNTVSILENQQKDGEPPASGYIPGSNLFPVAQTHINPDETGRADGGEICNITVPSLEDEKQSKIGEDAIPLPSKCRKINTDGINYEITKLIKTVQDLKAGLVGKDSFLQTSQDFLNEVQSKVSATSAKVAQWMSTIIQEIRKFVLRKINGVVNNLTGNAPLSSRYLVNEAKNKSLSICSCLFIKLLQNLEALIAQALNALINKIINTAECLIENFLGDFLGKILSQLTAAINGALGELSSLLGTIISFTTDILDFVTSILDFLSCKIENVCPVTDKWNFLEGGQPSNFGIDFGNIFEKAKGYVENFNGVINLPDNLDDFNFDYNPDSGNILDQCGVTAQTCGPPQVVFWGGDGSGAAGNAVVNSIGEIIGVDITNPGNYGSTPPSVRFEDNCGNGTGAVGIAILGSTGVSAVQLTTPTTTTTTPTTTTTTTTPTTTTTTPTTTTTTNSTYSLFAPSFVDEGQRFTLVVVTTNVAPGTVVYWDTGGSGITPSDFSSTTILRGSGVLDRYGILTTDFIVSQDNLTEGAETLDIYLYTDSTRTNRVANISVGINDSSTTLPTYSIVAYPTNINEGDRLNVIFNTSNVPPGTLLYWSAGGTGITAADFSSTTILSGSGRTRVSDGKILIDFIVSKDNLTEGSETLRISLYTDSSRTNEVAKIFVVINDTSLSPTTPSATTTIPGPATGTTGVVGVIMNKNGYNYLPKPNGSKGGMGRVWAGRCQTVVRRANGNWDPPYSDGDLIKLFFGDTIELPSQSPVTIDCNFSASKLPGCSVTGTLTCLKSMIGFNDGKGGTTGQLPNIKSMVGFDDSRGSSPQLTFPLSPQHQQRVNALLQTAEVKQAFIDDQKLIAQGLVAPRYRPDLFGFEQDYPYAKSLGFTDQDIRFYLEGFYLKILGKSLGPIMQVVLRDPNFGPLPKSVSGKGTPGVFDCTTDYPYAISLGFTDQDIRYYLENFYTGTIDSCMQKNLNDPNWGKIPEFYVTLTAPGCPPQAPLSPQAPLLPSTGNNYNVNTKIQSVVVQNGGFGYQNTNTVTVFDCSGNKDVATEIQLTIQNGVIIDAKVISSGSGYTCIPTIQINTNTGYNAVLKPVLGFERVEDEDIPPDTEIISVVDCVGKF